MTPLEQAMKAAREVTEMFGREEQVARAVLMAVRSEDPEIDQVGRDYAQSACAHGVAWTETARGTFVRMIDAILSEGTKPP